MVITIESIWKILEEVTDPEIPVLTIQDLGIVRDVQLHDNELVEIIITPTYSGCPAMQAIEVNIRAILENYDIHNVIVTTILSPAWTTDWLTASGREKLRAYGIAPPVGSASKRSLFGEEPEVECPNCNSKNTEMLSQFGSTACKSLYRCKDCLEPFDYFKCH